MFRIGRWPPRRHEGNWLVLLLGLLGVVLVLVLATNGIERLLGILATVATVVALVQLNYRIDRPPDLRIEYRTLGRDAPVVWRVTDHTQEIWALHVYLVNDGDAEAGAIRAEFTHLGCDVKGRDLGPPPEQITVRGAMAIYRGEELSLAGGEEGFLCCLLPEDAARPPIPQAHWKISASGMKSRSGKVEFETIPPPTP